MVVDAVELAQALIRCPSVTPLDAGAMDVLRPPLEALGFACQHLDFTDERETVRNLYARRDGSGMEQGEHLCFAGHVDVVPPGNEADWRHPPFAAEIEDGVLYGRGASDMKTAVACFTAAAGQFLTRCEGRFPGAISLLITGDEEGRAVNGTVRALEALAQQGEQFDACLVGEPTNPEHLGDMIKIGRRGSLNACLTVHGVQGHVAYPDRVRNPIPMLAAFLNDLTRMEIDQGNDHFAPSHLEITSVDVGNPAANVIPAQATAHFNIRFNDSHSLASLKDWLRERCETALNDYDLEFTSGSEAFLSPPGRLSEQIGAAVFEVTGRRPELSTSGGTSDARFIRSYCPVVEFGLTGQTMHQVDECVRVEDIGTLTEIYRRFLESFFSS